MPLLLVMICLDSPLCNQVCVEKVVVDTCTQAVAKENEQLKQEVARLTKDLTQVRSPMDIGEFGDLAKYECISWGAS